MAYPFLLDIPLSGVKNPEVETTAALNNQQSLVPNDIEDPDDSSGNWARGEGRKWNKSRASPIVARYPRECSNDVAGPSHSASNQRPTPGRDRQKTSQPCADQTGGHPQASRSATDKAPVIIDLTGDDESDDSSGGSENEPDPLSSSTPGVSESNPVVVKDERQASTEPTTPARSRSRSHAAQSVKPDPGDSDSEYDGTHPAAEALSSSRRAKRPADRAASDDELSADADGRPPPKKTKKNNNNNNNNNNKRSRPKKQPPPPTYRATAARAPGTSEIPGALDVDDSVLAKIKKCFERAEHAQTTETEAKAALFLASRLMRQHNVARAEVMQHRTAEERARAAGESRVAIRRADGRERPVPVRQWVADLACAMRTFFDVKCYSETPASRFRVEWVFYGVAQNTASAALAYEKIYNLVAEWARYKKGVPAKNSYCLGIAHQLNLDAEREKEEEMRRARRAEEEELQKRVREEEEQRRRELERLQPTVEDEPEPEPEPEAEPESAARDLDPAHEASAGADVSPDADDSQPESGPADTVDSDGSFSDGGESSASGRPFSASDDSSDESSDDDYQPDFVQDEPAAGKRQFDNIDDEIDYLKEQAAKRDSARPTMAPRRPSSPPRQPTPPPPPRSATPVQDDVAEPQWKSAGQLIRFRDTVAQIADDYLEKKGVKLGNRRRRGAGPKDMISYWQGKRDGRKIDVRQKALEDKKEESVKEEEEEV